MFILIHGMVWNVALDGNTLPLTSTLLCRDDIPPWTFARQYGSNSTLYLLPLTLMQAIIRPRTSYVLKLGPWPNICVEMYSCAFLPHKYIRTTTNFSINTYKLT